MDMSVKIVGLDNIGKASEAMRMMVAKEIVAGLEDCGQRIRGEAINSIIQGTKSGIVYKRGGISHKSSKEGEAPANDTGRLVGSINTYAEKAGVQIVSAGKGIVKYASMLEFGTAKMAARPFMIPSLEKSKNWIIERLNKAVRNAAIKSVKK